MAKRCSVNDCEEPRVTRGVVCFKHLSRRVQCQGKVKIKNETGDVTGTRECNNKAQLGTVYCGRHKINKESKEKTINRNKAMNEMAKLAEPYKGDLDPVKAFEEEYRRTYGRIKWYERNIGLMEDERDFFFGLTREVHVSSTEFPGTDRTYEARLHPLEEGLRWERTHLVKLTDLWMKAGLERAKLEVTRDYVDQTMGLMSKVVRMCGLDPEDPKVNDRLIKAVSTYRVES